MYQADPKTMHIRNFYSLFSGTLTPRPIAWISSKNDDGSINLAPYSFFSGVNTRPPIVMVSIGNHQGEKKHTSNNILREKECVIHIVSEKHLSELNQSAKKYEKNVSEVDVTSLEIEPSNHVKTPRIKGVLAAFECVLYQHQELPGNDVFFLEVLNINIDETYIKDGQIDIETYKPISRFLGNSYGIDYKIIRTNHPDRDD